jgi:4-amino-4-deoxy-L-arabinose transferase-like glycosyltransferase
MTMPEAVGRAPWWPVALILLFTALVYFHSFSETPIYLGGDEARFGTAADSIARTGRNLNGDRMPIFFHLGDSLDVRETSTRWYQPVLFYLIALTLKFRPLTEASIRIPTAIIGLVDVFLIYAVARRQFRGALHPIVAAMTLAMTPAHLIFSRQALDYICPLPFVLGWLWCLVETLETGSVWASLGSGVLLGVGFYSYIAAWMLMPAFLAMTLLAQWASGTRKWLVPAAAAGGFAMPLLAFVPWMWSHSDMWRDTVGRYKVYDPHLSPLQGVKDLLAYNSIQERISVYWDYFNPAFLFFSGGSNLTHGTRLAGVFLLPVAVFLVAGVYELGQRRRRRRPVVLAGASGRYAGDRRYGRALCHPASPHRPAVCGADRIVWRVISAANVEVDGSTRCLRAAARDAGAVCIVLPRLLHRLSHPFRLLVRSNQLPQRRGVADREQQAERA